MTVRLCVLFYGTATLRHWFARSGLTCAAVRWARLVDAIAAERPDALST